MNLSDLENGILFTVSTAAEGDSDWSDLAELSMVAPNMSGTMEAIRLAALQVFLLLV